jgi:hypothetical protein
MQIFKYGNNNNNNNNNNNKRAFSLPAKHNCNLEMDNSDTPEMPPALHILMWSELKKIITIFIFTENSALMNTIKVSIPIHLLFREYAKERALKLKRKMVW